MFYQRIYTPDWNINEFKITDIDTQDIIQSTGGLGYELILVTLGDTNNKKKEYNYGRFL